MSGRTTDVLITIRAALPQLSPSEQRVAGRALDDPTRAAAQTVTELARSADTSQATVVRFAQRLGYDGYPELRLALAAAGGAQEQDGVLPGTDIVAGEALPSLIAKVARADAAAVRDTASQLDPAVLAQVVDVVVAAGRVDLFGVGASAIVAIDLQMKLNRIGRFAQAWQDQHTALVSAALLGPGDVAVGISHSGATPETRSALAEARAHGATTVALTNFPASPLAREADLVLTTAARESSLRSAAITSRIAALTVVDCLFEAVALRDLPATRSALGRTHAAVADRSTR